MNARINHYFKNINGYALATNLAEKKNQIITFIGEGNYFDPATILSFHQSRAADGRYAIYAGDPVLINNIKSAINIITSLEVLLPQSIDPILTLLQSDFVIEDADDTLLNSAWDYLKIIGHGANLLFRSGPSYSVFLQLYRDTNELTFHLTQLYAELSALPFVDTKYLPLLENVKNTITNDIEPLLTQVKLFTPQNFTNAKPVPVVDAQASQFVLVCEHLKPIINNIREHLSQRSIVLTDELYEINETYENSYINLLHAHNAMVEFTKALKKIDTTLNMQNVFLPSTILMDVGKVITEIESIDFETFKHLPIDALNSVFTTLLDKIGDVIIELIHNAESAEIRLGLKIASFQDQLQDIVKQYINLSQNTQLLVACWQKRLSLRLRAQAEIKYYTKNYHNAIKQIKKHEIIDEHTSLIQLRSLFNAANSLPFYQAKLVSEKLQAIIYKKVGLEQLQKDILELETKLLQENQPDEKKKLIYDLKSLYSLHLEIEDRIKSKPHQDFSYQKGKEHLVPCFVAVEKIDLADEAFNKAANELLNNLHNTNTQITTLVNNAQTALLKEAALGASDNEIFNIIANLSPLDCYRLPSDTLIFLHKELKRNHACITLAKLFNHAYRYALNNENVRALNKTKALLIANDFNTLNIQEVKAIAKALNISVNDINKIMSEHASSYVYYFTGRYIFEHPLIKVIDEAIDKINIKNEEIIHLINGKFEKWDEYQQTALTVINNQRLEDLKINCKPIAHTVDKTLTLTASIRQQFPTPQIQNIDDGFTLHRHWTHEILPSVHDAKQQILSLLDTDLIDKTEKENFYLSYSKLNHVYTFSGNEPLLFRSIKCILNMFSRFEQICLKLQSINGIRDLLRLKTLIVHELNEFLLEIDDFVFQLHSIQATGLALFSSILADPLERLGQLLVQPLATISTFFNATGIKATFLASPISVSQKLNDAIAIIQNIEDRTKFPLIAQQNQDSDDEFLRKLQENILSITDLIKEIKLTKTSLVKMSQSGNRLYALPILSNLLALYHYRTTKFNPVYTQFFNTIYKILNDDVCKAAISELYIQAELSEARLGFSQGAISQSIKKICLQYESIIYGLDEGEKLPTDNNDRFPYTTKKIAAFNNEYAINKHYCSDIRKTYNFIQTPSAIKSLADLLLIRNTLHQLSPKNNVHILLFVDECIANSIGLAELETKIEKINHELAKIELKIIQENNTVTFLKSESQALKEQYDFFHGMKIKLNNSREQIHLTAGEMIHLQSLYEDDDKPSMHDLCHEVLFNSSSLIESIELKCCMLKNKIAITSDKIIACEAMLMTYQHEHIIKKTDYNDADLQAAKDLRNQLNEEYLPSTTFIDRNIVLDNKPLYKINCREICNDLNDLRDNYLTRNDNLACSVQALSKKAHAAREKVNILNSINDDIYAIEEKFNLSKNSLMDLLFDSTQRKLTKQALAAYKQDKFYGLFIQIAYTNRNNPLFKYKYAFDTNDNRALLMQSAKLSAGSSAIERFFFPIGRYFRHAFSAATIDDLMSYLAEYFTNLPDDKRHYQETNMQISSKHFDALTVNGSNKLIHATLNEEPRAITVNDNKISRTTSTTAKTTTNELISNDHVESKKRLDSKETSLRVTSLRK